jgi:hypothetical protein
MTGKKVAQVLVLFKSWKKRGEEPALLAYVSWFETKPKHSSGLWQVVRTSKKSVIEVTDIMRELHLIPRWESDITKGHTGKVKQELDRAIAASEDRNAKDFNISDWVLNRYDKFFINSWLDLHLYKILY